MPVRHHALVVVACVAVVMAAAGRRGSHRSDHPEFGSAEYTEMLKNVEVWPAMTFRNVAGAVSRGSEDGVGDEARFDTPRGLHVVRRNGTDVSFVVEARSVREVTVNGEDAGRVKTLVLPSLTEFFNHEKLPEQYLLNSTDYRKQFYNSQVVIGPSAVIQEQGHAVLIAQLITFNFRSGPSQITDALGGAPKLLKVPLEGPKHGTLEKVSVTFKDPDDKSSTFAYFWHFCGATYDMFDAGCAGCPHSATYTRNGTTWFVSNQGGLGHSPGDPHRGWNVQHRGAMECAVSGDQEGTCKSVAVGKSENKMAFHTAIATYTPENGDVMLVAVRNWHRPQDGSRVQHGIDVINLSSPKRCDHAPYAQATRDADGSKGCPPIKTLSEDEDLPGNDMSRGSRPSFFSSIVVNHQSKKVYYWVTNILPVCCHAHYTCPRL